MPIPARGEVAPVSKGESQQGVMDEETGETDRPSRSLCTPGGQGLGKGFRRSSVDPVDDETNVRVSSYLPSGARLERLEGERVRRRYLPFRGGSCSRQIFHTLLEVVVVVLVVEDDEKGYVGSQGRWWWWRLGSSWTGGFGCFSLGAKW